MNSIFYKKSLLMAVVVLVTLATTGEAQWVQTNGPYGGFVECFATNGSTILAGLAVGNTVSGSEGGIYRSNDNGSSWTPADSGIPANPVVYSLAYIGSELFAGVNTAIYRSTDNGTSWTTLNPGWTDNTHVYAIASIGGKIFAGTQTHGLFSSTDNGNTWNAADPPGWAPFVQTLTVIGTTLFLGDEQNIFFTRDSGKTWTHVENGLPLVSITSFAVGGSSFSPLIFASSYHNGVYVSKDSGESWSLAGSPDTDIYINFITSNGMNASAPMLFAGTNKGVYVSTDNGVNWRHLKDGMPSAEGVPSLLPIGSGILAGSLFTGVYHLPWNGTTWTQTSNGLPYVNVLGLTAIGSNVYALIRAGTVFCSSNNGTTWNVLQNSLTGSASSLAANGNKLYAGSDSGIFASTDSGTSWTPIATDAYFLNTRVSSLVAGSPAGFTSMLVAGHQFGYISVSSDDGLNWTHKNSFNSTVYSLAMSDPNIYAATNSGIYRSVNFTSSWRGPGSGLPDNNVRALATLGSILFAGTWGSGIYLSKIIDTNWMPASLGLQDSFINALTASGTELYAAPSGAGVWRRSIAEMLAPSIVTQGLRSIFDIQTFPDPASTNVTTQFTTRESGYAEILVVNTLGAEVLHIFSVELGIGDHSFDWDVSNFAPGNYWCVVRMDGQVQTLPMTILR